jgi:hypothetical protein
MTTKQNEEQILIQSSKKNDTRRRPNRSSN